MRAPPLLPPPATPTHEHSPGPQPRLTHPTPPPSENKTYSTTSSRSSPPPPPLPPPPPPRPPRGATCATTRIPRRGGGASAGAGAAPPVRWRPRRTAGHASRRPGDAAVDAAADTAAAAGPAPTNATRQAIQTRVGATTGGSGEGKGGKRDGGGCGGGRRVKQCARPRSTRREEGSTGKARTTSSRSRGQQQRGDQVEHARWTGGARPSSREVGCPRRWQLPEGEAGGPTAAAPPGTWRAWLDDPLSLTV